jgi:hypothetical protein
MIIEGEMTIGAIKKDIVDLDHGLHVDTGEALHLTQKTKFTWPDSPKGQAKVT